MQINSNNTTTAATTITATAVANREASVPSTIIQICKNSIFIEKSSQSAGKILFINEFQKVIIIY